jgi:hypothetical protein
MEKIEELLQVHLAVPVLLHLICKRNTQNSEAV